MKPATPLPRSRVLLIEDNPGDARLMREYLADSAGGGFELEHADTLATGLERLGAGGIDLVLLDPVWVAPTMPVDGKVTVWATFSEPGTYVLRSRADDGALTGDGQVTITVTK